MPLSLPSSSPGEPRETGAAVGSDAAPASAVPAGTAPLLEPEALQEMERDFSDTTVVERFAREFASTLVPRLDRLAERIGQGDALGAQDAVLSIASSAAMIGAVRLAGLARAVQRLLVEDDLDGASGSLGALRTCGDDTLGALHSGYPGSRGSAEPS